VITSTLVTNLANARYSEQALHLVRDLHIPSPLIYWSDLLITALVAWAAFIAAVWFVAQPALMVAAIGISLCAFYRGLCFLHEISHLRKALLRGFEICWNVLFGMPMLLPSFMYVGVHQHHHSLSTYGTNDDPEYLPFAGKPLMIAVFVAQGLILPTLFLIRFFILAPVSLISAPARRWVGRHASALSLNVKYCREIQDSTRSLMIRWELATITFWVAIGRFLAYEHVLAECLLIWYAVSAGVAVLNTIRTLGAHRYASDGEPRDREAQLIDSIDTPGTFWTELWAPIGLRYHALHHYFPGIPYHNLKIAHRRLVESLPPAGAYHQTLSRSLPHSLDRLCRGK